MVPGALSSFTTLTATCGPADTWFGGTRGQEPASTVACAIALWHRHARLLFEGPGKGLFFARHVLEKIANCAEDRSAFDRFNHIFALADPGIAADHFHMIDVELQNSAPKIVSALVEADLSDQVEKFGLVFKNKSVVRIPWGRRAGVGGESGLDWRVCR